MGTPTDDLTVVRTQYAITTAEERAYAMGKCPNCGALQFLVIAVTHANEQAWLRCLNCKTGVVMNGDTVSPPHLPLRIPAGLPDDEAAVWNEVRACLGVGANTSAVMMCRKLLMHVAVGYGLPAKNSKNRAPNFSECIDHLLAEGVITKRMQPWVVRIKDVGNEANHEIVPVASETAMDVAMFTQKLLELAYEMDDTMAKAQPVTPPEVIESA